MPSIPIQSAPEITPSINRGNVSLSLDQPDVRLPIAKSLQQTGSALQYGGLSLQKIVKEQQDQINDARASEAFNNFSIIADNQETTYLDYKGKDVLTNYDPSRNNIINELNSISDKLDNDIQKNIFLKAANRRIRSVTNSMTKHSIYEQRKYNFNEMESRINTFSNTAAKYWDTYTEENGDFDVYSGAALKEIEMLADKMGFAEDSMQRRDLVLKVSDKMHSEVISGLINIKDFMSAASYLNDSFESNELTINSYKALKNTISAGLNKENAIELVDKLWNGINKAASSDFETLFNWVVSVEGGYVANDAGAGPSKYGINAKANPDIDIENINLVEAREIYKKRYWDQINAVNLPPEMRAIAFDTAVNLGVNKARVMLKESNNNPQKMLDLRVQHYKKLIKNNPSLYKKYENGWINRLNQLEEGINKFHNETADETIFGEEEIIPSLTEAYRSIDLLSKTAEEKQYAHSLFKQRYNEAQMLKRENYKNILEEAENISFSPNSSWRNLNPEILSQLKPSDRARLVKGAPRGDDPNTVIHLLNNPSQWRKENISKYRSLLSEATFLNFYKQGSDDKNILSATIDSEQFNSTLLRNDFSNLVQPKKKADKELLINLRNSFKQRIDVQQSVKKRKLSLDEKQEVLDGIMIDRVMVENAGFAFFDAERAAFELSDEEMELSYVIVAGKEIKLTNIPMEERAKIISTLLRRKIPVTSQMIANLWVMAGQPGNKEK